MLRQAADQAADLDDLRGIQPDRGLVQDEEPGAMDDRLGQPHALPEPLAQLADRPGEVVLQSGGIHRL